MAHMRGRRLLQADDPHLRAQRMGMKCERFVDAEVD